MPLATEVDFLVGVSDHTRQGNVRVCAGEVKQFLAPGDDVPRLVHLESLLDAADEVASDQVITEASAAALQTLLAAGSATLGGARPKASVEDDGRLLIAKFPWREDEWDVIGWEKTALDLAEHCGVPVPARRLVTIRGAHVLLLERFDRIPSTGHRQGYLSARTLAERPSSAGNDYLDLVAAVEDHSVAAVEDLRSAWRRVAFSVAINNTDDHFHNHGFLRSGAGWRLAPAFDLNPDPRPGQPRVTALAGAADRTSTLRALVAEAAYFGLDRHEARAGLREISDAVRGWRPVAAHNGVPSSQRESVGGVIDDFCRAVDDDRT